MCPFVFVIQLLAMLMAGSEFLPDMLLCLHQSSFEFQGIIRNRKFSMIAGPIHEIHLHLCLPLKHQEEGRISSGGVDTAIVSQVGTG